MSDSAPESNFRDDSTATQNGSRAWWKVLRVSREASEEEIESAYRRLAHVIHPDRWQNAPERQRQSAERLMKSINAAFEEAKRFAAASAIRSPGATRASPRAGKNRMAVPERSGKVFEVSAACEIVFGVDLALCLLRGVAIVVTLFVFTHESCLYETSTLNTHYLFVSAGVVMCGVAGNWLLINLEPLGRWLCYTAALLTVAATLMPVVLLRQGKRIKLSPAFGRFAESAWTVHLSLINLHVNNSSLDGDARKRATSDIRNVHKSAGLLSRIPTRRPRRRGHPVVNHCQIASSRCVCPASYAKISRSDPCPTASKTSRNLKLTLKCCL